MTREKKKHSSECGYPTTRIPLMVRLWSSGQCCWTCAPCCRNEGSSSYRCLRPGRSYRSTQRQRKPALLSGIRGNSALKEKSLLQLSEKSRINDTCTYTSPQNSWNFSSDSLHIFCNIIWNIGLRLSASPLIQGSSSPGNIPTWRSTSRRTATPTSLPTTIPGSF